ncbi:MAG: O-antigen/teichoic acid export membrane protein [Pseudohongiellaceae bacterium]|jgi:O-antigen/teichoic acid export membrane protein
MAFALWGHPIVSALRFGAKLALAWFLLPSDYGEVMLAASLTFVAGHLALLGLDEAWVHARRPGPRLLASLASVHQRCGLIASLALALVGALLAIQSENRLLGQLLWALAPTVWFANLSVLPTAVLVRAQQFPQLFAIDVAGVLSWSAAALGCAALGWGPWSLVCGWYANAAVTVFSARRLARSHAPEPCLDEEDLPRTLRYGRHLAAADLTDFTAERAGGIAVGFGIGRAALGLYEQGLHVASVMVSYARQLSERMLMPILAESHRRNELAAVHRRALRMALVFIVPAHLLLAAAAGPALRLLPEAWHGAAPLAQVLTLAAAAHAVGLVSTTALKAGDWSRSVAALGLVRLGLIAVALALTLPGGVALNLAWGLVCAQSISAICAVALALQRLDPPRSNNGQRSRDTSEIVGALALETLRRNPAAQPKATTQPTEAPRSPTSSTLRQQPAPTSFVPGRLSVVVATYNAERFVTETLQSVLAQTWPHVELIVCDDGSQDSTRELLASFNTVCTVLHQDNAGVSVARNRGASVATGQWLAFLDHDDIWEADMVERQLACLAAHPEAGLVYGDSRIIDEQGEVHGRRSEWLRFYDGDVASELLSGNFIPIETAIMPAQLFHQLGGFNPELRFLEDYDLCLRIAALRPVVLQPEPVARYRIHGNNLTHQHEALLQEWVAILEQLARPERRLPGAEQALIARELAQRAGEVAWAALRRGDLKAADLWIARAGDRCPATLQRRLMIWRALLGGLPGPLARALLRTLPTRRLYGV